MPQAADFHDVGMGQRHGALADRSRLAPFPLAAARSISWPGKAPDPIGRALAAALALHVALAAVLVLIPAARLPRNDREDSVAVEILTPEQFSAIGAPRLSPKVPDTPAATAKPDSMTQATRFYSSGLLADPRSRQAREALPHLAREERIIQLCNIEALEQVHIAGAAGLDPDIVVAYAMAEVRLSDHALAADGGAFRSRGHWYNIRYRCTLAPDLGSVAAFAFQIGSPIPERDWASHDLAADTAEAD
jgi:hypothetical protein